MSIYSYLLYSSDRCDSRRSPRISNEEFQWDLKTPSMNRAVTSQGKTEFHHAQYVSICHSVFVTPYVSKIRMCYSCFRAGYIKNNCNSNSQDVWFAETSRTWTTLPLNNIPSRCINCNDNHFANDPKCPDIIKQKIIINIVAENIPLIEAKKKVQFYGLLFADPFADSKPYAANFPPFRTPFK